MSDHDYYIVMDPDKQTNDAPYEGLLTVWDPAGTITYAVDEVEVGVEAIMGSRAGSVICLFNSHMPWTYRARKVNQKLSDQEIFERQLEDAQAQKMREDRAKTILKPRDSRGGHDEGYR